VTDHTPETTARARPAQRGAVAVEFILTIPLLIALILAGVYLGRVVALRHRLTDSLNLAVRVVAAELIVEGGEPTCVDNLSCAPGTRCISGFCRRGECSGGTCGRPGGTAESIRERVLEILEARLDQFPGCSAFELQTEVVVNMSTRMQYLTAELACTVDIEMWLGPFGDIGFDEVVVTAGAPMGIVEGGGSVLARQ